MARFSSYPTSMMKNGARAGSRSSKQGRVWSNSTTSAEAMATWGLGRHRGGRRTRGPAAARRRGRGSSGQQGERQSRGAALELEGGCSDGGGAGWSSHRAGGREGTARGRRSRTRLDGSGWHAAEGAALAVVVAGWRSSGMGGEEAAEQARRRSREELAMGALRGEARGEVARR